MTQKNRESRLRPVSYLREGRLVPKRPRGLRARSVLLGPGTVMDWHSTEQREELLIALAGTVRVEISRTKGAPAALVLRRGQSLLLPKATEHRVLNRSRSRSHYLYVTGAA